MKEPEINVRISKYGKEITVKSTGGTGLSDLLKEAAIEHSYFCAGNGTCGKCRVRFTKGASKVTPFDEKFFTKEELEKGLRLSCKAILTGDCSLELLDDENDMIVTSVEGDPGAVPADTEGEAEQFGIAIDLGTTTIAGALVSPGQQPGAVKSASCVNHQRSYGSDVISRIAAAEDENAKKDLQRLAIDDIRSIIKELMPERKDSIKAVTIVGNTTMLHLLLGLDTKGLGKYPYTPESLDGMSFGGDMFFDEMKKAAITVIPGFSAFVGADITSGLFSINPDPGEKFFFLDLGTNAEMAYFDGEKLLACSAAAGPVFEAVGISCGVSSVPGAIEHVEIMGPDGEGTLETQVDTIKGQPPIGICGTGVLEMVSELARCGIMDETGLLSDEYFDEGFPVTKDGTIRFSQKDVRNVQMAKAAIWSGISALIKEDIPKKVYIAGGFGSKIDIGKIERLRMFPEVFRGKMEAVGNSALKGAIDYTVAVLFGENAKEEADKKLALIKEKAKVVDLSQTEGFDEEYVNAMNF